MGRYPTPNPYNTSITLLIAAMLLYLIKATWETKVCSDSPLIYISNIPAQTPFLKQFLLF
jgi:hypothetical protein